MWDLMDGEMDVIVYLERQSKVLLGDLLEQFNGV